jgi:hypothetical protein
MQEKRVLEREFNGNLRIQWIDRWIDEQRKGKNEARFSILWIFTASSSCLLLLCVVGWFSQDLDVLQVKIKSVSLCTTLIK